MNESTRSDYLASSNGPIRLRMGPQLLGIIFIAVRPASSIPAAFPSTGPGQGETCRKSFSRSFPANLPLRLCVLLQHDPAQHLTIEPTEPVKHLSRSRTKMTASSKVRTGRLEAHPGRWDRPESMVPCPPAWMHTDNAATYSPYASGKRPCWPAACFGCRFCFRPGCYFLSSFFFRFALFNLPRCFGRAKLPIQQLSCTHRAPPAASATAQTLVNGLLLGLPLRFRVSGDGKSLSFSSHPWQYTFASIWVRYQRQPQPSHTSIERALP